MAKVKIQGYVDEEGITEQEALDRALALVTILDDVNNKRFKEEVITKLYYITPVLGRIMVVVNEEDRVKLGVPTSVLANELITAFPLAKLPSNIVDYKELIVSIGSTLSLQEILDAAQRVADDSAAIVSPDKVSVVKLIDYNNANPSSLIMSSNFGNNKFLLNLVQTIITEGDPDSGFGVLVNSFGITLNQLNSIKLTDGTYRNLFVDSDGYIEILGPNTIVTSITELANNNSNPTVILKDNITATYSATGHNSTVALNIAGITKLKAIGYTNVSGWSGQNGAYCLCDNTIYGETSAVYALVANKGWGFSNTYNPNYDTFNETNMVTPGPGTFITGIGAQEGYNGRYSSAFNKGWGMSSIKVYVPSLLI